MEIGAALYVLLAIAVAILAKREFGRSGPGWFFLSLILTPLAGLLLFLLPPRRRPCPFCAESIQAAATVCRFCGRDVAPVSPSTSLPLRTRIVLAVLVTAVLLVALSQCHYRFQWWRGGGGIQVESSHWSLVNSHWTWNRDFFTDDH
jgi:hypothetical protein